MKRGGFTPDEFEDDFGDIDNDFMGNPGADLDDFGDSKDDDFDDDFDAGDDSYGKDDSTPDTSAIKIGVAANQQRAAAQHHD